MDNPPSSPEPSQRQTQHRSAVRRTLRGMLFVVLQLLLVLLLLESVFRIGRSRVAQLGPLLHLEQVNGRFSEARTTEELLGLSALGFRPGKAAGGVRLNERGFATGDYNESKAPDERRIAVLGDSFSFNDFPQEWMWHTLLEEELGEPVRVFSLGVPATSPDFYLRLWELEGPATQADLVLVGLTIGNDLTDDAAAPLDEKRRSPLLRYSLALRALRNAAILVRYRWIESQASAATSDNSSEERERGFGDALPGEPLPGYAETFNEARPSLPDADFRDLVWKRTVVSRRDREVDHDKWFARLRPVLAELDRVVTESGARCIFVMLPDEYQVDESLLDDILGELGSVRDDLAIARPQQRLRRFFERQGLAYIDLLPAFRERAAQGNTLYRPRDTHWNRAGNGLAASETARALVADHDF